LLIRRKRSKDLALIVLKEELSDEKKTHEALEAKIEEIA